MLKKLSLFPPTKDLCALVRHRSLLQGYTLARIFAPDFMKLADQDISFVDGGNSEGIYFSKYCEEALLDCDVLFVDYHENLPKLPFYKEVIEKATELGKEVIISRALREKLSGVPEPLQNPTYSNEPLKANHMYDIRMPVITVLTSGNSTDQLHVELALKKHFVDLGYNVSQIGSRDICQFLGFPSLPEFLHEPGDAFEKILKTNHFIKNLTEAEQPELLIIGVPNTIVKFNNKILQGAGVLPYIVCNAVESDVSVLCTYYGHTKKEYYNEMSKLGEYRLNCPINFFGISNIGISYDATTFEYGVTYVNLDSDFVLQRMNDEIEPNGYHMFNTLDRESMAMACEAVQDSLSDNVRYMK